MKPGKFALRDGDRLAVLRPDDIELAESLTETLKRTQNRWWNRFLAWAFPAWARRQRVQAFNAIIRAQPYTFVGLLSANGKVVLDTNGRIVGDVRKLDSLIKWSAFKDSFRQGGDP